VAVLSDDLLVVNAGSTSLKLSVVALDETSRTVQSFDDAGAVLAVGHRIVHGGDRFSAPVVIDDAVQAELERLVELAPLHNAPALDALDAARAALPGVPHVAVFDTAFHRTIPPVAATYLLPERYLDRGIHRFGFHGLSVAWSAERVRVTRLVVCHLGGGSSVTAVRDGSSLDTTMGFTPLEGVPMATRAGSFDPGALLFLLRHGVPLTELDDALEHESGLTALAGTGDVEALEGMHEPAATLALEILAYRVAQAVASMSVALGGLDALVFTAGIGEHSARVRSDVCAQLVHLGAQLDEDANRTLAGEGVVSAEASRVRVEVVHAREDVVAARAVREIVGG
jgi:acetate kinase